MIRIYLAHALCCSFQTECTLILKLLQMPEDVVSHKPDIKEININPVFPNRTALLHLHNMALSRAFFFSYILQSREAIKLRLT